MKLKTKIQNWLGITWFSNHVAEVIGTVADLRILKHSFEYYRKQVDIIVEARAKSKAAIEKSREDRRRKDTIVTGKVNELLSFLGINRSSLLLSTHVVEPIINLTRLTEAVQDLAKKSKETNRIARKVADVVGYSEQDQCFGTSPDMASLAGCCATTATRPGYLHERISQLERELASARQTHDTFIKAHNTVVNDIALLAEYLGVKIVTKPATSSPAIRVVESTAKKGKRS